MLDYLHSKVWHASGKSRHFMGVAQSSTLQQINGDIFSLLGSQQRRVYVVHVAATSNSYLERERRVKQYGDTNTFITCVEPHPLKLQAS